MKIGHDRILRVGSVAWFLPVIPAVFFIGLFMVLALIRMTYPYELEWMEGGVADHVARILSGQSLYAAPSVDFVAYRYAPLYYYVGAGLSLVLGHTFLPLRLISIVSTVGSLSLVFLFVRRETGDNLAGIIAAGVVAACYPTTALFYDLARVDALSWALLLWGVYVIYTRSSLRAGIGAGLLLSLAILTKQTAGPIAVLFVLYEAVRNWRRSLAIGITVAGTVGTVALIWNRISDGWFLFYTFSMGRTLHAPNDLIVRLDEFLRKDLFGMLPIVLIGCIIFLPFAWISGRRHETLFYGLVSLGFIGTGFVTRIHPGGWTNALIPCVIALAIVFGIGVSRLFRVLQTGTRLPLLSSFGLSAILLVQFALMLYSPSRQLPTQEDEEAGNAFVARIRAIDGDVFIPYHGYLSRLAGKKAHMHYQAERDLMSEQGFDDTKSVLISSIRQAINDRRFAAIILDRDWYIHDIKRRYELCPDSLFSRRDLFYPVSGWLTRCQTLYVAPGTNCSEKTTSN